MILDRRRFLAIGGTVVATMLAGCGGNSIEEIEAGIEETNEHLQAVDPKFETAAANIDNREWESCFDAVNEARNELDAAEEASNEALALAEEEGHSDHAAVLNRQQEYIAILRDMADEIELACEAGQEENAEALERHWQNVQALDDERHAKRREIEEALNKLR